MNGKIADRSNEITEEEWLQVNEFNRRMVDDYLSNQTHLSPQSLTAYKSALRIFFVWVKDNLNNKNCIEIRKKEFLRYMNWLANRGFSESGIKFKNHLLAHLISLLRIFMTKTILFLEITLRQKCKSLKLEKSLQKNR